MDNFTVSFFGHRRIYDQRELEQKLEHLIGDLIRTKEYVEFLVGRDGDFDLLVSSVIHRCQRTIRHDNSAHVWVLPYETAEFRNHQEDYAAYYDEIEVYSGSHYKAAFQNRNRVMVDRSDLVVCYVKRQAGGAFQTVEYARDKGKQIMCLSNTTEFNIF